MQGLISYVLIFRNAKEISTPSWHSSSLKSKAKEWYISSSISLWRDYCPGKLNVPWPSHLGSGHWCSTPRVCSNSPWAWSTACVPCDCWPLQCPLPEQGLPVSLAGAHLGWPQHIEKSVCTWNCPAQEDLISEEPQRSVQTELGTPASGHWLS